MFTCAYTISKLCVYKYIHLIEQQSSPFLIAFHTPPLSFIYWAPV